MQISWASRLAKADAEKPSQLPGLSIAQEPFPTLLLGAAIHAGQPCLLWSTQDIWENVLSSHADKLTWSLAKLMCFLDILMRQDEDDALKTAFQILVEPFYLMALQSAPDAACAPLPFTPLSSDDDSDDLPF